MARVNDFRDFDAFKACRAFVRETGLLVRTPSFVPNRNLANQMERASISVLSNFAEGYERDGNAEFIQFLSFFQRFGRRIAGAIDLLPRRGPDSRIKVRGARHHGSIGCPAAGRSKPLFDRIRKARAKI
jgi:23S rRNA-intervening sequence protein